MAPRPRYSNVRGPCGSFSLCIGLNALPCTGVALRLIAFIHRTPGMDGMPPVTINFFNNLPHQQSDADAPLAPASAVTAQAQPFTRNTGDFFLFSQLQRVEAMVAAAGVPRECAPSMHEFVKLSARHATNSFSVVVVVITMEANAPGSSIVVDEYGEVPPGAVIWEEEDEEVPPGVVVGECAICYTEYVVGGATSANLLCGKFC